MLRDTILYGTDGSLADPVGGAERVVPVEEDDSLGGLEVPGGAASANLSLSLSLSLSLALYIYIYIEREREIDRYIHTYTYRYYTYTCRVGSGSLVERTGMPPRFEMPTPAPAASAAGACSRSAVF